MTRRFSLALLALAGFAPAAHAATIDLGPKDHVAVFFSTTDEAVLTTVGHYLTQSLTRDGYAAGDLKGVTLQADGHVAAEITGEAGRRMQAAFAWFLPAGQKALDATDAIRKAGGWQPTWSFFLPLGLAMTRNVSVELLHFPPDYSLTSQDYLNSTTTDRWASLLVINSADKGQTPRYQAITDIDPIAAPANAGDVFPTGPYGPYSGDMLEHWAADGGLGKPVVAFGAPVQKYVNALFKTTLKEGDAARVTLPDGVKIPLFVTEHPSAIYYEARYPDKSENFKGGMAAMNQNLTAACWQVALAGHPEQDPVAVGQSCKAYWASRFLPVCELLETSIYNRKPADAARICKEKETPSAS